MRERIADTLRNAILTGELKPGQRITEAEVAARLGTSRAPVREAIRELVNEGFLDSHAYRETRVSRVTLEELREVLVPIRIVAETFALRRLMTRPNPAVLQELEGIVAAMQRALADHDRARVIDLGGPVVEIAEVARTIERVRPGVKVTVGDARLPFPDGFDDSALRAAMPRVYETPLEEGVRRTVERFEARTGGEGRSRAG